MKNLFIGLLLAWFSIHSQAQIITGKILDSKTNIPLEFVSVGVIGKNIGTVSDNLGAFKIDISKVSSDDAVRFSFIGYRSKTLKTSELHNAITIYLEPQPLKLNEVVISDKQKIQVIGETTTTKSHVTGWGGFSVGSGGERGILIQIKEETIYPKEVIFSVARCAYDSVLLRLHVRNVENGLPKEELLPLNVYYTFTKKQKTGTIDLLKLNLRLHGDVMISLEWLKAYGQCSGPDCMFQFSLKKGKGVMLTKEASEGVWSTFENVQPSIAIRFIE